MTLEVFNREYNILKNLDYSSKKKAWDPSEKAGGTMEGTFYMSKEQKSLNKKDR
jgi:hypothetical protein